VAEFPPYMVVCGRNKVTFQLNFHFSACFCVSGSPKTDWGESVLWSALGSV